ncbi:class I SAM-dependent methyltransferase [Bradyrhizobium viridifuturi]|uniref:class I SAM-dependent methyltransferase n=1 Tax=Bradyrhizobium TaxID=374 RepID=UPI000397123B|nr:MULTISPECIES: class I SAM-dependent methyltransferase [Bradyrhizobium]ERF86738.1 MAG: branched-chain amino acid transport system ATP-binding protein [Bradyrhizobium sp. DFCI-1]OYU59941.1 MAG: class I SAM-dependent methyltransferase [Bradyrhizobium sp. PARBB1]PSO29258.1 class I SAM-dependent methyltransferase [Bradyrhizobium sp. MOS004]QRI73200.1 class I SAM-dependent methyltransferase [Bradyrhizobium sp. PSBB068]MBR1020412.1 class I SAM-dependent methyltransferase [Bradyrhizobium viridifutu
MTASDRQSHWQTVYLTKGEQQVSWSQADPQPSLRLIESVAPGRDASITDIGGGASRLVDALVAGGFHDLTVLDLSEAALASARERIGARGEAVRWVADDATVWQPPQAFDIWHDRAAFHFLVEEKDRAAYLDRLHRGVKAGGHAVIGTFAPDGPEKCSGLPVRRYDSATLGRTIGPAFELIAHEAHRHVTPWGATQSFQFNVLRRR